MNESKTNRIRLSTLTEEIRTTERIIASGSESSLWVDYCEEMLKITGISVTDDTDWDPEIKTETAAWWLGAYAGEMAIGAAGSDPFDADGECVIPTEPAPADIESLSETLGHEATENELREFEQGFEYIVLMHIDRLEKEAG